MDSWSIALLCLFLLFTGSLEYHTFAPIFPVKSPLFHFPEITNRDLRFVAAVWRHGSRAPLLDPFVKSPEDIKARWAVGMGELTQNGENEMVLLGRLLRRRYRAFFRSWTIDSLSVTSSAIPRAIKSAELVLKGMFPEIAADKDCTGGCLKIPIEVIPAENDTVSYLQIQLRFKTRLNSMDYTAILTLLFRLPYLPLYKSTQNKAVKWDSNWGPIYTPHAILDSQPTRILGRLPFACQSSCISVCSYDLGLHLPFSKICMLDLNYANCPYPYRPPLVSTVEIPGKEMLTKKHEKVLMQIAKIIKRKPKTMDTYGLHDALLSYRHHGSMKSLLPDWARSDDFYNALSKAISESKAAYVTCQEYRLLRGSNLFKRIADQLSEAAKTNESEPSLKFAGYSAHDFTLIALLVDWDFYIPALDPQFAACIMVELRKTRGQYFVQVLYKQGHYRGPFQVKIKDCDLNCPLEKFVELAEKFSSIDISNRCAQFEANNLRYVPTVH
ncbi:hypothetical protein M513_01617 [Trichuris suis]|uniref:Histidine acid phosphatase n=1 Tax=Trichuris suis TaxID=68888 RepID=A0A085MJW8_9BILA|nr:hypothetical protein M513_01617 [Trichuris suis]